MIFQRTYVYPAFVGNFCHRRFHAHLLNLHEHIMTYTDLTAVGKLINILNGLHVGNCSELLYYYLTCGKEGPQSFYHGFRPLLM